ncbi:MAG TPA: branched-chain amino acid ABC transporter permease [Polyangiales bacterium]|nr:branched-chain amino acid ABC transporter permease [Polyangiales bacterium]
MSQATPVPQVNAGSLPLNRTLLLSAACGLLLLFLPLWANNYVLSIGTLILFLGLAGQAWNVMMGFAGLLSLGHALYIGLGAYTSAALFTHYEIGPWLSVWPAAAICALAGVGIGALAFRFSISGVQFSLLTIAFAEFTRIGFDHIDWLGGPAGLFLKVQQREHIDLLNLRGPPAMFYYVALGLCAGTFALCRYLLQGRAGYYWQAIRENEDAARALGIHTFRWKILAVAISAALTGVAGVFFAFYYNSLFPEQAFHMSRSIEIILAPVIGGIGSLVGPVLGAALLTLLGDLSTEVLNALGSEIPGVKQVLYGCVLLIVVWYLPHGVWPALARALGVSREQSK